MIEFRPTVISLIGKLSATTISLNVPVGLLSGMLKPEPLPVNVATVAWAGLGMNAQIAEVAVAAIATRAMREVFMKKSRSLPYLPPPSLFVKYRSRPTGRDRYNPLQGHDLDFDAARDSRGLAGGEAGVAPLIS
jgi:hypothetical protein